MSAQALSYPIEPGARVVALVQPHLRALDGIRFVAAFLVLAGHGYWYVVCQQTGREQLDPVSHVIVGLPGLGMTLFFVLSGFVIHYNYHSSVGLGRTGNFDFFVARFSRLYPLFLAVFAVEFSRLLWLQGDANGAPHNDFDLFGPLPFFLSFTQTWLFIPYDGKPLYEHYGLIGSHVQATGAMWSLSTEALLYLLYPFISGWLSRRRGRSLATVAATVAAGVALYYAGGACSTWPLQIWGARLYGSVELGQKFTDWLLSYSPIGRFGEFLLGAAAAQFHLAPRTRGIFARRPELATAAVTVAVLAWNTAGRGVLGPLAGVGGSLSAGAVACFILLATLHRTRISRVLGSQLLVKGGEASYSLYLLHFYTMHEWAATNAAELEIPERVIVCVIGIAMSVMLARGSYLWFERPAQRWLRGNFARLRLHVVISQAFIVTTLFCIVTALHIHAVGRIAG